MLIRKIFLSWRQGSGSGRYIVGELRRNYAEGVQFKYIPENVALAKPDGFQPYPEFIDIDKTYTEGVLEIFARRLTQAERTDRFKVFAFWEANNAHYDDFDLLALTQGWLPTDNFEFLGCYFPNENFKFVTDLARVGSQRIPRDTIKVGDELRIELDRKNKYDNKAVKVYKDTLFLGYIKQKHCNYFHRINRSKSSAKITVKALDQNGEIRQIFTLVS